MVRSPKFAEYYLLSAVEPTSTYLIDRDEKVHYLTNVQFIEKKRKIGYYPVNVMNEMVPQVLEHLFEKQMTSKEEGLYR